METLKSSFSLWILTFALLPCFSLSIGVYQYFQLVQQFQPNACYGKYPPCAKPPQQIFTIHGLWPSNHSNNNVKHSCSGSTIPWRSMYQNQTFITEMTQAWPDVEKGNDSSFWRKEWDKHGTCSEQTYTPLQYFKRSLEIYFSFNITEILLNGGVIQGKQFPTSWDYAAVASMIKAKTTFLPLLRCKKPKLQLQPGARLTPASLLYEVSLCYNYTGTDMINCTSPTQGMCPPTFYFY